MTITYTPTDKIPLPHQDRGEKLPWERLYLAHEGEERTQDPEWDETLFNFKHHYRDFPNQTEPPITLELLASTAAALRPIFGAETGGKPERVREGVNALAAKQAFELLSECADLLNRAKFKEERLARLKKAYEAEAIRVQSVAEIKFNPGLKTITQYVNPQDSQPRFKAFLEVFYGEVLYYDDSPVPAPWMPPLLGMKTGEHKAWAAKVYETHQKRGFFEAEVVFYTQRFKFLEERGFLEKSTPRSLSRTKAKEKKQKAIVSKHS
jgi:hypothetical protein